jgi:type I restriction enzyme S subunit
MTRVEWTKARLDACTEIVAGATPSTSVEAYWGGDVCWATPKDMSDLEGAYISDTPRKLTRAGLENCAAAVLPAGSVLFSSRAPIGHVAVNTVPMATNQGFKSFVPKSDRVIPKFLYWWLRTNRVYLESLGNGATFKEVSKTIVSRIEIPLPPLAEQRRIAEVLDRAEVLRAKRRAALAQLDSLTQSLFLDLFGDPATNPKGWPVSGIEDACELIVDCVNRTAPIVDGPTPFKMIRTTNVKAGKVNVAEVRYVTEEVFNRWNRRATPQRGDVLLTREAPVGEAGMLESDDSVFLGQRLMLYRTNHEKMTPEYLLASFRGAFLQHQFNRHGSGSTVKHLPLPACRSFQVHVPPLPLQREFARWVTAVEKLKAAHRASLAELDALFATLQHRAFRGEL